MIAWVLFIGSLLILLTLPARIFGWLCGCVVRRIIKPAPPFRPPIAPR